MFSNRIKCKDYFIPNQINEYLNAIGGLEFIYTNKKIEYANTPCSFDIETTSFKSKHLDKCAIMYEWTLNIDGHTMIGRYWEELIDVFNKISEYYMLGETRFLIVYVHNLSFEFQFIRKRIDWNSIFSLEKRKPVKCSSKLGIEFRCSYTLSGYSLRNLGKQLVKYRCEKLDGDLDYSLKRHSETPLTEKEIGYCINDCMVVVCYIKELMERLGDITKIPLTKTGFVRRYCRDSCLYDGNHSKNTDKFHRYRNLMRSMILDSETYSQLKRAFAGGFTHASCFYSGEIVKNVDSFDFTSSYPAVMVSEQFPMSSPEKIELQSIEEFKFNIINYCCLFDIEFTNIRPIFYYENYISKSKCINLINAEENNGRIVSADKLKISITEQDYMIIRELYDWDDMEITNFKRFKKGYLPRDFILAVLKLYKDKTELKDIPEKIVEYQVSKEQVNSCYGMLVTDICRDEILYNANDDWCSSPPNIDEAVEKYNNSIKRFMYYPWGVWVTAYARRNLFTGILEFGEDYIYSDTDSIKGINIEKHMDYILNYNKMITNKLKRACVLQKIDFNMTCPKNVKGETKQLGIWEHETDKFIYTKFKTLGAKRYLVEQNGKLKITMSGVAKSAVNYLQSKYLDKVFENFDEDLYIPPHHTGKMTHTYIDEKISGYIKDYKGKIAKFEELSCTHLEDTDYTLSISETYAKFLAGIKLYEK